MKAFGKKTSLLCDTAHREWVVTGHSLCSLDKIVLFVYLLYLQTNTSCCTRYVTFDEKVINSVSDVRVF